MAKIVEMIAIHEVCVGEHTDLTPQQVIVCGYETKTMAMN